MRLIRQMLNNHERLHSMGSIAGTIPGKTKLLEESDMSNQSNAMFPSVFCPFSGVGKCPNWTSPYYWGYFISNRYLFICFGDVKPIPKRDIYRPLFFGGGTWKAKFRGQTCPEAGSASRCAESAEQHTDGLQARLFSPWSHDGADASFRRWGFFPTMGKSAIYFQRKRRKYRNTRGLQPVWGPGEDLGGNSAGFFFGFFGGEVRGVQGVPLDISRYWILAHREFTTQYFDIYVYYIHKYIYIYIHMGVSLTGCPQ